MVHSGPSCSFVGAPTMASGVARARRTPVRLEAWPGAAVAWLVALTVHVSSPAASVADRPSSLRPAMFGVQSVELAARQQDDVRVGVACRLLVRLVVCFYVRHCVGFGLA